MRPSIRTSELPETTQPGELLRSEAHHDGVTVIIARTGKETGPVSMLRDIIMAEQAVDPATFRATEDALLQTALARLIGYKINHLVVACSESLSAPNMDLLSDLAAAANASLTLAYGIDCGDQVRAWGQRMLADDVPWHSISPELHRDRDGVTRTTGGFPDEVPWVDFPLFLHTASITLDAEDYAKVEQQYWAAYVAALSAAATTTEAVADLLQTLMQSNGSPAQAVTILRGVQAASLMNGYLLKADLTRLHLMVAEAQHRRLVADEVDRLRGLPEPWRAAIVILSDAGYDNDAILSLNLADIDQDGLPRNAPRPLLDEALPLLRTQRIHRLLDGASPDDLFIDDGFRRIQQAMRAAAHLGLPIDVRRSQSAKADRWQHRAGIIVKEIA